MGAVLVNRLVLMPEKCEIELGPDYERIGLFRRVTLSAIHPHGVVHSQIFGK